jgi:hypothetical protein
LHKNSKILIILKNNFLTFFFLSTATFIFAQAKDATNIKTVIFKPIAENSYAPIVPLGQKLWLSFDDLNADEQEYTYKVEHCDANWNLSNLIDSEFIIGFSKDRIREYNNSFNTLLPYTNYQLELPNQYTKFKISGNYLLSIINESSEIVFQRRFVLYETTVVVAAAVHKSRDISQIDTHQSVQFTINYGDLIFNNPSEEIKTVILQNNNWQTAITGLKPQFYRGNQLLYLYGEETSFWAGNEFLYFDTKGIREASIEIAHIELGEEVYNTYLYTDEERINSPYTLAPDINGNFVIRTLYGDYQNIEADYTNVHFYLECLEDLSGKDVFVSGNFNNWQLNNENQLLYNQKTGLYEGKMLMKQGFYNYQFVTLDKEGTINNHDIEGSHYQTDNDYTVLVYYKKFGARYTRVIGVGYANSRIILN